MKPKTGKLVKLLWVQIMWQLKHAERLEAVVSIARLVANSPPRSAQTVRLLSKLKEKIEELDEE